MNASNIPSIVVALAPAMSTNPSPTPIDGAICQIKCVYVYFINQQIKKKMSPSAMSCSSSSSRVYFYRCCIEFDIVCFSSCCAFWVGVWWVLIGTLIRRFEAKNKKKTNLIVTRFYSIRMNCSSLFMFIVSVYRWGSARAVYYPSEWNLCIQNQWQQQRKWQCKVHNRFHFVRSQIHYTKL